MKYWILIFICISAKPLFSQEAHKVEVIKFDELEELINDPSHQIQVINFWATWCKPCIKELPFFEVLKKKYESDDLKVLLISFDFAEDLEKKVIPFIKKRGIKSEVKLLDETDFNAFIDKIDPSWTGAIPATLVINNKTGTREFYEKEFKQGELDIIIEKHLD